MFGWLLPFACLYLAARMTTGGKFRPSMTAQHLVSFLLTDIAMALRTSSLTETIYPSSIFNPFLS